MSLIVVEATRGRCATFMVLTATVSEIFGGQTNSSLSPLLFNVYMDALSSSLSNTPIGCSMGGVMVNHIMYADDLVIISPSAKGLQRLLDIMC